MEMKRELDEFKEGESLKEAVENIAREVLEEYKEEIVEPEVQTTDTIRDIAREVLEERREEPEIQNTDEIRNIARVEVRENNDIVELTN